MVIIIHVLFIVRCQLLQTAGVELWIVYSTICLVNWVTNWLSDWLIYWLYNYN